MQQIKTYCFNCWANSVRTVCQIVDGFFEKTVKCVYIKIVTDICADFLWVMCVLEIGLMQQLKVAHVS